MSLFSKRKQGLFKKSFQLNSKTGSHVAILLFSPAGRPHTNAPLFDAALSRYFRVLGARGDATTAAGDIGVSGSKDDSFVGLWLDSVEGLQLGVEGVATAAADHADGSSRGSENGGSVGMWPVVGGEGGASAGYCSARNCRCIREWLNSVEVEGVEKLEDLLVMKQQLENIKEKVMKKVEDAICSSFLA